MLEVARYACANWVITPAALALGEGSPASISEQRFQLVLTGIAFLDLTTPDGVFWKKGQALIRPDLNPPLEYAIDRHGIPAPPGEAGNQYTREFLVEQCAPYVDNASISTNWSGSNVGWACDAWRPHHYETRVDAFNSGQLHPLFAGVEADLAVRGWMSWIQRVNYHVTLIGKIRFAAVIIT